MTIINSIKKFYNEYDSIKNNQNLRSETKDRYELQDLQIQKIYIETIGKINEWKKDKISVNEQAPLNFNTASVLKKATIIRTSLKVAKYAAIILGVLSLAAFTIASSWLFASHLGNCLDGLVEALLMQNKPAPYVVPFSVKILTATGLISGTLSLSSWIAMKILNASKTLREERIICDENFKEFVERYIKEEGQFIPSCEHLSDRKLHDIFVQWQNLSKKILNY